MKDKQGVKETITIKRNENKYIKIVEFELDKDTINERIKYLTNYNRMLVEAIETNNTVYETNVKELLLLEKALKEEI